MIPSLGGYEMKNPFWADSSTVLYNATAKNIWPTVFTQAMSLNATEVAECLINPFDLSNLQCPTAGFLDVLKWFVGLTQSGSRNELLFTDLYSSVQRKVAIKTDHDSQGVSLYATVLTELASRTLGSFYSYARRKNAGGTSDVAYPQLRIAADTPLLQPIIFVRCSMSVWHGDSNRENISFPSVEGAWGQDPLYPQVPGPYLDADNEIFDGLPDEHPRFSWYKDNDANASSSLLALAIVPAVAFNATGDFWSSAIVACSADARWAASDAYYQPLNSSTVSSNVSDIILETDLQHGQWIRPDHVFSDKPLDLQPDWAAFFNANQTEKLANSSSNTTGMAAFLETAIMNGKIGDSSVPDFTAPNVTAGNKNGGIEETIAMLLGAVLADGVARGASGVYSFLKTDTTAEYDVVTLLELPIATENSLRWNPVSGFYSVRVKLDSYGYGYGLRNTAGWVAMIVLLVFTLTVLVHGVVLGCAVARQQYYGGECWEDVAELMALAMNSTPSEKLNGTGAGVERSETWRNVVKIRETDDQRLELRFVDRYDEDGGRVIIGKAYL
ncbi:hypothetical protein J4E90_004962 [Alternaria incomplexa]|uniref:uncharacterized protein n=1 Tax=Alternaria incomplexa TaxID=1187928 RepID=UPI00221F28D8|nr:uncharacterized protein J4E90_004962 [Alternaria incomplexa]KAI4914926.1 hypothetical protein J4E90_004962 [Alternaria incomplexa]